MLKIMSSDSLFNQLEKVLKSIIALTKKDWALPSYYCVLPNTRI